MTLREGCGRVVALVFALLAGACAGPMRRVVDRPVIERTPSVSVDSIMAPVRGDGLDELAALQRLSPSPANELRRAYILAEGGDSNGAVACLNRVLFGEEPPVAGVEALARYLRARARRSAGAVDEAADDIQRALDLADDPKLRSLLQQESLAEPVAAAPTRPTPAPAPSLAVLPRSAWGARPLRQADLLPMEKPFRITIHHTAVLAHSNSEKAAAAQIFRIQGDHQNSESWADIGYHLIIDRAGRVWEGRPLRWQGAHAGGDHNRGNIGVCLLGRFVRGGDGQEPTREQAVALDRVLRHLCRTHALEPGAIHFHRRYKATECPGARLEAVVNDIRRRMEKSAQS